MTFDMIRFLFYLTTKKNYVYIKNLKNHKEALLTNLIIYRFCICQQNALNIKREKMKVNKLIKKIIILINIKFNFHRHTFPKDIYRNIICITF